MVGFHHLLLEDSTHAWMNSRCNDLHLSLGSPDLFITVTCCPTWKEITDALLPGQKPHDRPDNVARVFHLKVKQMIYLLTKGKLFGKVGSYMYSIWLIKLLYLLTSLIQLETLFSKTLLKGIWSIERVTAWILIHHVWKQVNARDIPSFFQGHLDWIK